MEFTPHTDPLRPLPREQHRHRLVLACSGAHRVGGAGVLRQCLGATQQGLGVLADEHGPVLQRGPGPRQRVADVHGVEAGAVGVRQQASGLGGERRQGLGREQPRNDRQGHRRGLGGLLGLRRLLQDHVRVGAAHTERGNGGAARLARLGPLHRLREQLDGPCRPVHVRGRLIDVQGARQHAFAHRHDHLDDARHACGARRVTDVRLQRAQPERPPAGALLAVRRNEGPRLDRVTEAGARAVRLHRVDLRGGEARVGEGGPDHALLRGAVRNGEPAARAVLVDRRASDDAEYAVAVATGVREALDQQHADTLAPAGAVRRLGERLAPAVLGEAPLPGELQERARGGHDRHTARERHGAFSLAQRLGGPVQCHQRRRARGVHGRGGALEAEGVGDAARHDAGGAADGQVAAEFGRVVVQERGVVLRVGSDEHPGPAAVQGCGVDARLLEGLPGGFEEESLLRVHRQCLARRDTEELGVEVTDGAQESALIGIGRVRVVRVGVIEPFDVPAAVVGEVRYRVDAVGDQPPQLLGRPDVTGKAAAHADDGNRLLLLGLHLLEPLLRLAKLSGHPLQVVQEFLVTRHRNSTAP
ncbi:hypothetical protein EES42_42625 [Streptomyces sp. ADI95-17]|nr:hypothetical protein EES42_42625 [Streptomyces sp. ADI95-17]